MDTYTTRKLNFPNMAVTVHCPVLTPEEKQKRLKKIEAAAARLLKAAETKKE